MTDGSISDESPWTASWYVLRPSGLHLYVREQQSDNDWEAPMLSVHMSTVESASAGSGADFYQAIFVLHRTDGRELTCHATSRLEMRKLLGLFNMHAILSRE